MKMRLYSISCFLICTFFTKCVSSDGLLSYYHTNEQMYEYMRNINQRYPNLTHLYSVGKSANGKDLMVIAISAHDADKHILLRPETKYVGNMHGNEPLGRQLLLKLISHMLEEYNKDPIITQIMIQTRIHILPSMNPDGFAISPFTCDGVDGRTNSNKQDLNRDFPDVFHPLDIDIRQPESLAVRRWLKNNQFVLSANLHGGSLVANYPYDSIRDLSEVKGNDYSLYSLSEDDDTFQYLARKYSLNHRKMSNSSCQQSRSFVDGITNGADWYIAFGTMQDYNYVESGCMELTLEIGCCKFPTPDKLPEFWLDNKKAMVEYLNQGDIGVKGLIYTSDGKPAPDLSVVVDDRMVVKTTPLGEYWKLLLPGNYSLKASIGDQLLTTLTVEVKVGPASVYNITLPYSLEYLLPLVVHEDKSENENNGGNRLFFGSSLILTMIPLFSTIMTNFMLFCGTFV